MAKITIQSQPRVYNFTIDTVSYVCQMEWKDTFGVRPVDILITELEECLEQLKRMPNFKTEEQFKLPPIKNDSNKDS